MPAVTAIAICYNHAKFVAECLNSIRSQTFTDFELIILDDASKDGSTEVIRAWIADSGFPCKFIAHESNAGICRTLNEAVRLARGKYIAMVATDDLWLPDRLRIQHDAFENLGSAYGVVYSDALQINETGDLLPSRFIETRLPGRSPPRGSIFDALIAGPFIPAMATLIRRECYDYVGLYDESLVFEDYDMWLRISRRYLFEFIPMPLAKYRIVGSSMIRTRGVEIERSTEAIFLKWLADPTLSPAERQRISARQAFRRAIIASAQGEPNAWQIAWRALRTQPGPSAALLFLCTALRLSHSQYEQLQARLRRVRSVVPN